MLRIAICDDEAPELSQIMQIVEDYREGHPNQDVSVMAFQSSEELLESREKNQFHIYLLDGQAERNFRGTGYPGRR